MERCSIEELAPFVGTWRLETDLPVPEGVDVTATSEFAWLLDGAFLLQTSEVSIPGAPNTHSVIAVSVEGDRYTQHYFDSRGVVRIYEMAFDGSLWRLVRDKPDFTPLEFKQRFIGTFEDSGQTIRGRWEIDHGSGWELDFHLDYRKIT